LLRDPQYRLELRLEPGHLITYDNNRVLHGRAPFDPSTGERHLQGCYLNLEDVDSTLRLLDRTQA
jgi:gamma-butyrobetaine dioxygenase